jgi:coenzyme PQQ synthesis protein D (PqqD)
MPTAGVAEGCDSTRGVTVYSPADLQSRPRRHPDSAYKSIADEGGLVVLPGRAEVKVLNPSAVHIYGLLDGEHTLESIARSLHDEYEVSFEQAAADVKEFVGVLEQHGMLAGEGPS